MKKLITDSYMISQIKERIHRLLPKAERLNVKVEMTPKQGHMATIKFRSFGREFVAKKAAPFYRESLERTLRAINSQVDRVRSKQQRRSTPRPEPYPNI